MTEDRVQLVVEGRVQGVGFRWFVQHEARKRELAGWVRNLPDGRVEIVVAGPPDALDALARAVATGPAGAEVTHVDTREARAGELPRPFAVLRP